MSIAAAIVFAISFLLFMGTMQVFWFAYIVSLPGFLISSFLIGFVVVTMGALSLIRFFILYSKDLIYITANFLEMLIWSGLPFPFTWSLYLYLVIEPSYLDITNKDDLLAQVVLRNAVISTFGLNILSILLLDYNFHKDLPNLYLIHLLLLPFWFPFGLFIDVCVPTLAVLTLLYLYVLGGEVPENIRDSELVIDIWWTWVTDSGLYDTVWPQIREERSGDQKQ